MLKYGLSVKNTTFLVEELLRKKITYNKISINPVVNYDKIIYFCITIEKPL